MRRGLRWVCAVLVLAALPFAVGVAEPAWACGCGAYIPDRPGAAIATERALIVWDGDRQDIVMSFSVAGRSDTAAWVMPVPSAAEVTLGDPTLFEELGRITAPRIDYRDNWWPTFDWLDRGDGVADAAAAAPRSAVDVLGRQRLGPFDVTRLAADDATALATWLADNGFPTPGGLDENLAAYVADGWELVAVKLVPASASSGLTGDLQPLRLSFDSDTVVYPMRLSRSATTPQNVDLYVLSDHRMDPSSVPVAGHRPALEFAGALDAAAAPAALAPYLAKGAFLTRWADFIAEPAAIDGDYVFARAAEDRPFQRIVYITRDHGDITSLILVVVAGMAIVAIGAVALRRILRRSSAQLR